MLKNTKARFVIAGAATALGLLLPPGVAGAVETQIVGFTYAGSGCPANSVGWVLDQANNTLTVDFDSFATYLPPGVSKACTLTIVTHVPPGFQVTLNDVYYQGYIETDPTVAGKLFGYYDYRSGLYHQHYDFNHPFPAGKTGTYTVDDPFVGWGKCATDATVTANVRVNLTGTPIGSHINELVVDSEQISGEIVFYLSAVQCP